MNKKTLLKNIVTRQYIETALKSNILDLNSQQLVLSCWVFNKKNLKNDKNINSATFFKKTADYYAVEKIEFFSDFFRDEKFLRELDITEVQYVRLWTYMLADIITIAYELLKRESNNEPIEVKQMMTSLLLSIDENSPVLAIELLEKVTSDLKNYVNSHQYFYS